MKACRFCGKRFKHVLAHEWKCVKNTDEGAQEIKKLKNEAKKIAKKRYYEKLLSSSIEIECACGCGQKLKSVDKYGRKHTYISGHNTPVKYDDPTQYKREWNHRNRKKRFQYKIEYGRKRRVYLIKLLGGKCRTCGKEYNGKNAAGFDFHHVGKKSFALSMVTMVNKKWEDILKEAQKCILVCAFCHRIHHWDEF